MQFSWWTFVLQVINFLILAWLLQRFLYKPVRQVLEKRRALVDDKLKEAEKAKEAAEKERKNLEAANAEFKAEREKRMAKLHSVLAAEKDNILAGARAEAEKVIEQARQRMESERIESLEELKKEIADLAAEMAAKILTERPRDNQSALQQFKGFVSGLSDDELRRLRRGGREDGSPVEVVTAEPLDPSEQATWKDEIATLVGAEADIAFEVDKSLLGGAEVRLPQAAIKLSLSDALAKFKESILSK